MNSDGVLTVTDSKTYPEGSDHKGHRTTAVLLSGTVVYTTLLTCVLIDAHRSHQRS